MMMATLTRQASRPSTLLAVGAGLCLVNVVLFATIVQAQQAVNPTPLTTTAAPAKEAAGLSDVMMVITIVTSAFTLLVFLVGFVWFVWKGKNIEELNRTIARQKDELEGVRGRNADLKEEVAELKQELTEASTARRQREREAEELRKANLRLQGIHDAE